MSKQGKTRPVLGPSDAVLSAPLHPAGVSAEVLTGWRPQISGAADAVTGAPLAPPPDGAREGGLQLGVDTAGGYVVAKQLDGHAKKKRP